MGDRGQVVWPTPPVLLEIFPFVLLCPQGEVTLRMQSRTTMTIPTIQRKLIFQTFLSNPTITIYFVQYNFSVSGMGSQMVKSVNPTPCIKLFTPLKVYRKHLICFTWQWALLTIAMTHIVPPNISLLVLILWDTSKNGKCKGYHF